jgi:hypothetical protein
MRLKMNPGTSKPPIKTLPLSLALSHSLSLSLSLSSESAILQLQEVVADEMEDESWNFKTTHQKHCKPKSKLLKLCRGQPPKKKKNNSIQV